MIRFVISLILAPAVFLFGPLCFLLGGGINLFCLILALWIVALVFFLSFADRVVIAFCGARRLSLVDVCYEKLNFLGPSESPDIFVFSQIPPLIFSVRGLAQNGKIVLSKEFFRYFSEEEKNYLIQIEKNELLNKSDKIQKTALASLEILLDWLLEKLAKIISKIFFFQGRPRFKEIKFILMVCFAPVFFLIEWPQAQKKIKKQGPDGLNPALHKLYSYYSTSAPIRIKMIIKQFHPQYRLLDLKDL